MCEGVYFSMLNQGSIYTFNGMTLDSVLEQRDQEIHVHHFLNGQGGDEGFWHACLNRSGY